MNNALFQVSIRKSFISIVVLGIGFSFSLAALESGPFLGCVIVSVIGFIGLLIYLVASFVIGVFSWRKISRWWFAPFLVSIVFLLSVPIDKRIGIVVADWNFRAHLSEYLKTVDDIKSGSVPSEETLMVVSPNKVPSNVKVVMAAHYFDGATVVVFLVGSGFPLQHSGYVFDGSDKNINCGAQFKSFEDKYRMRHVTGNWYHFSG
jgi:hypothetical protein